MTTLSIIIVLLSAIVYADGANRSTTDEFRLAFASCNHQDLDSYAAPVFRSVAAENVHRFLWLGDAIYADERIFLGWSRPHSIEQMASMYQQVQEQLAYRSLVDSVDGLVSGVYDDHDFACNDADSSYQHKRESQQLFLRFIGEPMDSPRWTRAGLYGDVQLTADARLITLDGRYFRDDVSLLGVQQWHWLSDTLNACRERIVVLASGTPVFASRYGSDAWQHQYRADHAMLVQLMEQHQEKQFVILSGDVHVADASCVHLENGNQVWQVISSGVSHAWGEREAVTPSHHTVDNVGDSSVWTSRYWVSLFLRTALSLLSRHRYAYFKRNFGVLTLRGLDVQVSIKDVFGKTIFDVKSQEQFECRRVDAPAVRNVLALLVFGGVAIIILCALIVLRVLFLLLCSTGKSEKKEKNL